MQNDQILRIIHSQNALAEDRLLFIGNIDLGAVVGHGVAVLPLPCRRLDEVQLLYISGNCRLRAGKAPSLQQSQKLLLRFHDFLRNNFQNHFLTVIFHILQPP